MIQFYQPPLISDPKSPIKLRTQLNLWRVCLLIADKMTWILEDVSEECTANRLLNPTLKNHTSEHLIKKNKTNNNNHTKMFLHAAQHISAKKRRDSHVLPVCFFGSSNRSAELMDALPENLSSRVLASYWTTENFENFNQVLCPFKLKDLQELMFRLISSFMEQIQTVFKCDFPVQYLPNEIKEKAQFRMCVHIVLVYLRAVLFSKVHIRRDGFYIISKFFPSFSRVWERCCFWFPSGGGPDNNYQQKK